MKPFQLSRNLLDMGGQFYPRGHIVAMFPTKEAAEGAARALAGVGVAGDDVSLIPPEVMLGEITHTIGNSGSGLPSAGTEADTTRRFAQYASQGHHALLIRSPDSAHQEQLMDVLRDHQVSHAQRYGRLVIEDLA